MNCRSLIPICPGVRSTRTRWRLTRTAPRSTLRRRRRYISTYGHYSTTYSSIEYLLSGPQFRLSPALHAERVFRAAVLLPRARVVQPGGRGAIHHIAVLRKNAGTSLLSFSRQGYYQYSMFKIPSHFSECIRHFFKSRCN